MAYNVDRITCPIKWGTGEQVHGFILHNHQDKIPLETKYRVHLSFTISYFCGDQDIIEKGCGRLTNAKTT